MENRQVDEPGFSLKNLTLWKILLVLLAIIFAIVFYRRYTFNRIITSENIIGASIGEKDREIGVLDDKYYKLEGDTFKAFGEKGEMFSFKTLDVVDILYDKYIYITDKSGAVYMIDRFNGKIKKQVTLKEEIRSAKLVNGNILLFFRNGLALLDQSLTIKERLEGLQNPASFDQRDGKIAFIELSLKNGKINSDFTLKTGEDKFTLSSVSETFLFTKILADRTILVSNAYIYSIVDNAIVDKVHLEKVTAVDSKDDKLALVDNKKLVIFDKDLKEIDRQDLGVDIGKISMRRNSIILIADNKLIVYENKNKIEANIENAVDYYENDAAFYTIFKDKIERVNAD